MSDVAVMTIDGARRVMHDWTDSEALRVHMECVSACMAAYADHFGAGESDSVRWRVCGLLHDFDYEKHPSLDDHPRKGVEWLRVHTDADEEILAAIMGHNPATGVARETDMARALFAVDELAGFIVACVKVRPNGISDLQPRSVKKKLKDKAFAAAVNRGDIQQGIDELGVDASEHIQRCIDAIRGGSIGGVGS